MNLFVDIGNSRVKWACGDWNNLYGHGGFFYTADTLPDLLERNWRELMQPEKVYIASVADFSTTGIIQKFAREAWSREPQLAVTEKERAGLRNAYADVASMGVDRWLAMLAAWNRFRRPVCVMDCGTAVTIDVILEGGQHTGGFILPGLTLMSTALIQETDKIYEHDATEPILEFGRSTSACIRNGFAFALAGLVENCVKKIREEEGVELLLVITGGGAEQALSLLPGDYSHEPHLVLEGLSLIG